jgi:hypothetical protein
MTFKYRVTKRYKVVAYERELAKIIDNAEQEYHVAEDALHKAREQYEKLLQDDGDDAKLDQLEKEIDELVDEYKKAAKNYEEALHTTIDDLKADRAFEEGK